MSQYSLYIRFEPESPLGVTEESGSSWQDIVACRPVPKRRLFRHRPLLGNALNNRRAVFSVIRAATLATQQSDKRASAKMGDVLYVVRANGQSLLTASSVVEKQSKRVRIVCFPYLMLARRQFASGRSCDRPTRSRFPVVFLDPGANAELVPRIPRCTAFFTCSLPTGDVKISP
jgi:hypothetical protein